MFPVFRAQVRDKFMASFSSCNKFSIKIYSAFIKKVTASYSLQRSDGTDFPSYWLFIRSLNNCLHRVVIVFYFFRCCGGDDDKV